MWLSQISASLTIHADPYCTFSMLPHKGILPLAAPGLKHGFLSEWLPPNVLATNSHCKQLGNHLWHIHRASHMLDGIKYKGWAI